MLSVLIVLLVAGVVIFVNVQAARKRRRALVEQVKRTTAASPAAPITVKQGNVTVRVTTSTHATDPRYQPMAEEIAKAFSFSMPDMQAQAETLVRAMQKEGAFGISREQAEAIGNAFRQGVGVDQPVVFDADSDAFPDEGSTVPFSTDESDADVTPSTARLRPQTVSNAASEVQPAVSDPFSAGNIFEAHREAAENSFQRDEEPGRNRERTEDLFGGR